LFTGLVFTIDLHKYHALHFLANINLEKFIDIQNEKGVNICMMPALEEALDRIKQTKDNGLAIFLRE